VLKMPLIDHEETISVKIKKYLIDQLRINLRCPNAPAVYVVDQALRLILDDTTK
jgi:hypothetical protein